jgi:hypothetical protein
MSEKTAAYLVMIACVGSSIGGMFYAAFVSKNVTDGGRGGAIGVAVALGFLFITRDYGTKFYTAVTRRLPDLKKTIEEIKQGKSGEADKEKPAITIAELEKRVNALVGALTIDAEEHKTQNVLLALATFIGTLVWGFGDIVAQHLIAHFGG